MKHKPLYVILDQFGHRYDTPMASKAEARKSRAALARQNRHEVKTGSQKLDLTIATIHPELA
jgi:hypothetical protein